jgi:hypothetical protein
MQKKQAVALPWQVALGTVVSVEGCQMKLTNVNEGKRRVTFTVLPCCPFPRIVTNPVVKVPGPRPQESARKKPEG